MPGIEEQSVNVGDLFRDNDPRLTGQRIVKVLSVDGPNTTGGRALVEVVEHWNEKAIGRKTLVLAQRLRRGRNAAAGYTKVSH